MSGANIERINLTEREIKSIATGIVDERYEKILTSFNVRFDRFEESWEKREKNMMDDLVRRMTPIMGDFKDKAVIEAEKDVNNKIFLVLGVKTDDGSAIDALREGLSHAKETAQYRKRVGRLIIDRATTSIISILIAAVIYTVSHFINFADSPTGKILGVMGDK